eukprot:m.79351 g.79351  ORF g.79351 m.79351 type:complete len:116 (+) comp36135_c0_seq2:264-611(+)
MSSVSQEVKERVADKLTACLQDSGKLVKHLCQESTGSDVSKRHHINFQATFSFQELAKAAKAFASQDSSILAAHDRLKRIGVTLSDMTSSVDTATRSAQSLQRICRKVDNLEKAF